MSIKKIINFLCGRLEENLEGVSEPIITLVTLYRQDRSTFDVGEDYPDTGGSTCYFIKHKPSCVVVKMRKGYDRPSGNIGDIYLTPSEAAYLVTNIKHKEEEIFRKKLQEIDEIHKKRELALRGEVADRLEEYKEKT